MLDAAARVFADRGYRGASVEEVAAEAGVTKGALYWHFKSKEDLLFALLEERVDRPIMAVIEQAQNSAGEDTVTPFVSIALADVIDEQRQMLLLTHEYWSLAARDATLNERYVARERAFRASVAEAVTAYAEATEVPLILSADDLATGLVALTNGLAMERVADPSAVPDGLLGQLLLLIYDGLRFQSAAAASSEDSQEAAN